MIAHTIQLSEKTYGLLLKQAARLRMTPEDVLARILASDLALLTDAIDQDTLSLDEQPQPMRRSRPCGDYRPCLPTSACLNLDAILDDPMFSIGAQCAPRFHTMSKTFSAIPEQAVMIDTNNKVSAYL